MKRSLITVLCFQLLAMTASCQTLIPPKPPEPIPIIPSTKFPTNLEEVWLSPWCLDSAGGDYIWDFATANEQYIIVATIRDSDGGRPRGIGVYNMQTGKRHSAWTNDPGGIFGVNEVEDLMDCKTAGKNKEIILIYNRRALFGYSLHSGQRLWTCNIQTQTSMGEPQMSANGDYAFISYNPTGAFSKSWCRLAKIDVYSGEKNDILELKIEDNYEFSINPPSAYVSNNGDTLLYFTVDALNFDINKGRAYAYCYNLTKKQMLWENKQNLTPEGASSFDPPPFVIENDKLIITTRKAITCLDKNTGELIWQRENLSFSDMPPLYWEGKLYIRCRTFPPKLNGFLLCLDAQSGQQLWENTTSQFLPAPHGRMAIYQDKLYFSISANDANSYLSCVDIHTGNVLWQDWGSWGNISHDVLIDQKTGYLYCYTGWATMCVDLNKTPKK